MAWYDLFRPWRWNDIKVEKASVSLRITEEVKSPPLK